MNGDHTTHSWFFVGADLGQARDYTALAVVERALERGEFDYGVRAYRKKVALRLRYLERVALGTPYPQVVERIVELTGDRQLAGRSHLTVDGTGVGRPVVDLLRQARPEAVLQAVTITGAQMETMDQGFYRVPKRDLIIGLQVLLQRGGLKIAAGLEHARTLVEELEAVEVRVSAAGNEQYAAWREGTHDDLVFAVALACWSAGKTFPGELRGLDQWWTNREQDESERIFRRCLIEEARRMGG